MNKAERMGTAPIPGLLVKFAVPSVFSLVLHALYNIVDRMFIGKGVGSMALAGVTLCFPVLLLLFGMCLLFASGAASQISIYLGEQSKKKAEEVLGNTICLCAITGVITSLIGLFFSDHILMLFSATSVTLPHAREYLNIISSGSVLFFFGFAFTFIIRAEGNPLYSTLMMTVGALLNIGLDALFIFTFKMGTAGAALATVISESVIVFMGIFYIMQKKGLLHIKRENLPLQKNHVYSIIALGASPALMNLVASLQQALTNNRLQVLGGETALAAIGIVFSVMALIFMFTFGMSGGMQPLLGYNFGARNMKRVKHTFILACSASFVIALFLCGGIIIFAEPIVSLFSKENGELLKLGTKALRICLLMTPLSTFQILSSRFFQSIGRSRLSIFTGLSRQLILYIPALLIFSSIFGLPGVWYSVPFADFAATFFAIFFIWRVWRKF